MVCSSITSMFRELEPLRSDVLHDADTSFISFDSVASLAQESPSHITRNIEVEIETGEDKKVIKSNDPIDWLSLSGLLGTILDFIGLLNFIRHVFSFFAKYSRFVVLKNEDRKQQAVSVKRLLFACLCSLGSISVNLAFDLLLIMRDIIGSGIFAAVAQLGLVASKRRRPCQTEDTMPLVYVQEDRLEEASHAIKQLRSESLTLREKLIAASERISNLEANQADYAAFRALQVKYTQVSAEIARLTTENEELKANSTQLTKINEELRQCLVMKESDLDHDADHLTMLARLQNQCLDSCIFPKDEESEAQVKEDIQERANEASEDSIIIVTEREPLECKSRASLASLTSSSRAHADASSAQSLLAPHSGTALGVPFAMEKTNPIPVFTTQRPSLPPKGSKIVQLKPLLLASHFAPLGYARRNVPKPISIRMHHFALVKNNTNGKENTKSKDNLTKSTECGLAASANRALVLNPRAPVFIPRISTTAAVPATNVPPTSTVSGNAKNITRSTALSPTCSPFIFNSPSPNSPFLRPPPPRRQSSGPGAPSSLPSLTTTPATPTTPIAFSPATCTGSGSTTDAAGTPRSTRASSVRLIRARAAMRNSKRVASGSAAVLASTPQGMKTMAALNSVKGTVKHGPQEKMRLLGKGQPPPRRALVERTNAAEAPDMMAAAGRWTSL